MPTYSATEKVTAAGIAASGRSVAQDVYPIVFYQHEPQIGFLWAARVLGFDAHHAGHPARYHEARGPERCCPASAASSITAPCMSHHI